jgi:hypothetical protein
MHLDRQNIALPLIRLSIVLSIPLGLTSSSVLAETIAECDPRPSPTNEIAVVDPCAQSDRTQLRGTSCVHALMEGYALVQFVISKGGKVEDPKIVESYAWSPRYGKTFPGFYDKAALMVVGKLEYKHRHEECRMEMKITWIFDPDQ